jgi:hypothetical protein
MNMRGKRAECPAGCKRLNVTSCQAKNSPDRLKFSPFSATNYKGFHCFENYWQSRKLYENIPYETTLTWWQNLTVPKRRYPTKEKVISTIEGYDYITSRKLIYVPEYYELVKQYVTVSDMICVYDFDGPRKDNGDVDCVEVTLDLLKEKINDPRFPFGHGYVVAALLLGIHYSEFCT